MLRRSNILTAGALALCCALAPAAAADPFTDSERKLVEEYQAQQSVGGPGRHGRGAQAGRGIPGPAVGRRARPLHRLGAQAGRVARGAADGEPNRRRDQREFPVVAVSAPSGGFDWDDAGIGAAGMVALFSIAAGSALLIAGRRRRHGAKVATH